MIVFAGNRGRVIRLEDPGAQGSVGFVAVKDPRDANNDVSIGYINQRSIITRLTVSQNANVQFLHTLGAAVYIYVFGDRIGELGLSGLSFNKACEGGTSLGVELMLGWYKTNRIAQRGTPVRVMVGNTALDGFVTGANVDVIDPETAMVQWGLTMRILPDGGDAGGSSRRLANSAASFGPDGQGGPDSQGGPGGQGGLTGGLLPDPTGGLISSKEALR